MALSVLFLTFLQLMAIGAASVLALFVGISLGLPRRSMVVVNRRNRE